MVEGELVNGGPSRVGRALITSDLKTLLSCRPRWSPGRYFGSFATVPCALLPAIMSQSSSKPEQENVKQSGGFFTPEIASYFVGESGPWFQCCPTLRHYTDSWGMRGRGVAYCCESSGAAQDYPVRHPCMLSSLN